MLRQKPTQVLPKKLLKEATIHFYCLFDESRFSDICTIMELKELYWLCKHMKTLEATNHVFQWIFVLNSVKQKFFHVSIVFHQNIYLNIETTEVVLQRCSVKRGIQWFSSWTWNFIKKENLAQVFSCEFYKIFKNSFFYRTPLVAASLAIYAKW